MSQAGSYIRTSPAPGTAVQTLTGNVGGPVGPDLLNNINIVGTGDITVTGFPITNTLQISLAGSLSNSFPTDAGTATPVAGVLNILGGVGIGTTGVGNTVTVNLDTPVSIANGGTNATSMTNTFGVNYFDGTSIVTTTVGTAAQVLTSNGVGLAPTFQAIPSSGVISITGDAGGAVTGAVTLTGGTSGIVFTGSLGTTLTVTSLGTTNHAVQVGNATGTLTSLGVGTNGQVLIGSTGANPTFATLTSTGGTIIYTTGAGTLNLEASGATASSFPTDAGTATPVLGALNILGGVGIGTTGVGNTVTANLDVPVTIANGGTNATSMATTDGTVYFDGTSLVTTTTGTAGQVLTSNGVGLAPTYQSIPASGVVSITGDSGGAQTGAITLTGGTSGALFAGAAGTITESFNFLSMADTNVGGTTGYVSLGGTKYIAAYGGIATNNIFIGNGAGIANVGGTDIIGIGANALNSLSATPAAANSNVGIGTNSLTAVTTSAANVAIGQSSLGTVSTGSGGNTALGHLALQSVATGTRNTGLGRGAGQNYTGSESSNIMIANDGTLGESNTLRIGVAGSGTQQVNRCFIAGISGVAVASSVPVFIDTNGQMGTGAGGSFGTTNHAVQVGNSTGGFTSLTVGTNGQVLLGSTGANPVFATLTSTGGTITYTTGAGTLNLEASGGVTSITGTSGGAQTGAITLTGGTSGSIYTGAAGTITESFDFISMTDTSSTKGHIAIGGTKVLACWGGVSTNNIFVGETSGISTLSGTENSFLGAGGGTAVTSGSANTAAGYQAMRAFTTASNNTAVGRQALEDLTTGGNNVACGYSALTNITTGTRNNAFGYLSGSSYTGADSHNICVGNTGTVGESNVLRIGTNGTGTGQQSKCFIAGIAGVTVANNAAVLIDTTTGQLGTVASSRRYKEDIQDLQDQSRSIMKLRPVSFTFKKNPSLGEQYGLIAEEVQEVMPYLVVNNDEGEPDSVRYHELPTLLLKELQRLELRIKSLETQLALRTR